MKRILLILIILAAATGATAQERFIARGAEPGELYISNPWYGVYSPWGPPYYDTLQLAIFRLTENGKNLTIQYDADYFAELYTPPDSVILLGLILADATPGVVYIKHPYAKNDYANTSLWVSFDYGKSWTFKEENIGRKYYYSANIEGLIYRAASEGSDGNIGTYKSYDYADSFTLIDDKEISAKEPGFDECEFFTLIGRGFYHTHDCFQNYINLTIDEEFVFGNMSGDFPDVYRGGLPDEIYISSWFPDWTYKVSFSADTGHTFRHLYISEPVPPMTSNYGIQFMSDREPGVFYIIRNYGIEDFDPWGHHVKICVEHYRDYGETLVGIYCHDVTKDYGDDVGIAPPSPSEGGDVWVYPNPTGGELQVTSYELQMDEIVIWDIIIWDIMGKRVLSQKAEGKKQKELDISHLPSGMYFVRIMTERGIINRKIVKH